MYGYLVLTAFGVYLISACASAFYALRFLNRPGISTTARRMIVRRHLSYIIMNIFCQMYNMVSKITTNMDPQMEIEGWYITIMIVLFFGQGFFMNIIRTAEPTYLPSAWF